MPPSEGGPRPRKRRKCPFGETPEGENNHLNHQLQQHEGIERSNEPITPPEGATGQEPTATPSNEPYVMRSSRKSMPAQRLIKTMMVELTNATESDISGKSFCLQAMFPNYTGTLQDIHYISTVVHTLINF